MADNFDKFRPDWTVGTLTLTGGSTAFTATNAELILAAIREGDAIITPTGFFLPIETLDEDGLTGTLSNPAPAAAAGTFDTRIRYQSDNSRFTGALLALTRQLTGGNLQSFGNLQGLQDLMPIFLGPGSVGLIGKSEVGIQDPNGSLGKLAVLTLAANKILKTDASGELTQSDITAWAISMLSLTGVAEQMVYLNAEDTSALTPLTAFARSILDDEDAPAVRTTIGLGNVNNTSDADKPVSNATQTALNGKLGTSGGTLTGGVNITSNADSAVRFLNTTSYGYTVYFNSGNGTTDNGLQVVHSSGGLIATFLYNRSLAVVGALSKGSGTFLIDHPLDPLNKNLRHGFVESTEYVNIYRGMIDLVDGRMTVDIDAAFGMMDGTFAALNADVMVSSLQNQFGKDRVWVEAPADSGKFTIICENTESTASVAWMVTGRRKDAFVCSDLDPNTDSEGRFIPEFDKPEYIEQEADHA